jgi:D-arginine dehydrogenase
MIYDVAIIGAGMAGASLAAELDPRMAVLVLEGEMQPGYHATGRSAAFWDECYGGAAVQPLTTASGPFLAAPASEFSDQTFLRTRGSLYIGKPNNEPEMSIFFQYFRDQGVQLSWLEHDQMKQRIAGLKRDWTCGIAGPDCSDIDVAALHFAYLRRAKENGTDLVLNAAVDRCEFANGRWKICSGAGEWQARLLVNAAGAWADQLAQCAGVVPIGHQPRRRTIAQLRSDPAPPSDLPLVIDFNAKFYFKPEVNGKLWLSPHDETDCPPGDVAPEEIDVAVAIDRLSGVVDWRVTNVERKWAGLRTFAPDRLPVFGFDEIETNFFWCTGQGGFGIQTAPAAARLCAALIGGNSPDPMLKGIDPAQFAPGRFTV